MPYGILTVLTIGNVHAIFGVLNVLAFGNVHDFGVLARLLRCTCRTRSQHTCAADCCIARYGHHPILQTAAWNFDCYVGVCLIFPCTCLLLSLLLTIWQYCSSRYDNKKWLSHRQHCHCVVGINIIPGALHLCHRWCGRSTSIIR